MLVTYPALFYYDDTDGTEATYFVHFPDFEYSATQGEGISEALAMGSEWLGITVADLIESDGELPQPSDINSLSLIDNDPLKMMKISCQPMTLINLLFLWYLLMYQNT